FLPDKPIAWRDVAVGAVATALLFPIGKSLIGLYIGSSNVAERYGTAGSLIIILLWIYYTTLTFLFGAEFTRAYAQQFGSHAAQSEAGTVPREAEAARTPARHRATDGCQPPTPSGRARGVGATSRAI